MLDNRVSVFCRLQVASHLHAGNYRGGSHPSCELQHTGASKGRTILFQTAATLPRRLLECAINRRYMYNEARSSLSSLNLSLQIIISEGD